MRLGILFHHPPPFSFETVSFREPEVSLAASKTHNPPAFAPYSARVTCVHQAMLIWLWLVDLLADFAWTMGI